MSGRNSSKVRTLILLCLPVFWVLIALLSYTYQYFNAESLGLEPPGIDVFLIVFLPYNLSWCVLLPGIYWLSRLLSTKKINLFAQLGIHVLAAVLFITLHALLHITIQATFVGDTFSGGFSQNLQKALFSYSLTSLLTYAGIAGASYAWLFFRQYHRARIEAMELEDVLGKVRLQNLANTIQPHFLFNTLQTINVLAMQKDSKAVSHVLDSLGEILRYSLKHNSGSDSRVKTELGIIRKYIEINKKRFANRLVYNELVDEGVKEFQLPAMILLTIFENIIKHAVEPSIKTINVELKALKSDGKLIFLISNDGPVLSEDKDVDIKKGMGIKTINKLLKLRYGDSASLRLSNTAESKVLYVLSIPASEASDE